MRGTRAKETPGQCAPSCQAEEAALKITRKAVPGQGGRAVLGEKGWGEIKLTSFIPSRQGICQHSTAFLSDLRWTLLHANIVARLWWGILDLGCKLDPPQGDCGSSRITRTSSRHRTEVSNCWTLSSLPPPF